MVHPKREAFIQQYVDKGFRSAVSSCLKDVMKEERKCIAKIQVYNMMRKIVGVVIKKIQEMMLL